ncbi:MAG: hypothetical protein ACREIC_09530, partial [Limisphaerales bacterium]
VDLAGALGDFVVRGLGAVIFESLCHSLLREIGLSVWSTRLACPTEPVFRPLKSAKQASWQASWLYSDAHTSQSRAMATMGWKPQNRARQYLRYRCRMLTAPAKPLT